MTATEKLGVGQRDRFRAVPLFVWARLIAAFALLCGVAASLPAQTTIPLSWVRDDSASWNQVEKREPVFRKEPAYAGAAVTRGMIALGPAVTERVAFAFDETGKRVYVDMNRDLDLTNDSTGVVTIAGNRASLDVALTTATQSPSVHVEFWKPDSQQPLMTRVCGTFRGKFVLDGRKWSVHDGMFGPISLRRLNSGTQYSIPIYGAGRDWILNGRSISLRALPEDETTTMPALVLTTHETSMGTLLLPGKDVEYVSLSCSTGTQARESASVLIDGSMTTVDLPAGIYRPQVVRLSDARTAFTLPNIRQFTILPGTTTTLAVGGPIRGGATGKPSASRLLVDYSATGIGGESYDARTMSSVPVRFAIYKGARRIAAGKFEYG